VQLLHHEPSGVGAFALVGMGAVFSGIIRAPMTSVLIIIEMTGGYSLILPLMLANMTAYGLVRHFRPTPVYEALLEQDGIRLREKAVMDVLESVHVEKVFVRAPVLAFDPTSKAPVLLSAASAQEVYPVVGEGGALVGLITSEDLRLLRAEPELGPLVNAADLMRPPAAARLLDDLHAALEMMLANQIAQLPVVDDAGKVIGFVGEDAIAKVYLRGRTSPSD
jgi:CIC family chloride channel protein